MEHESMDELKNMIQKRKARERLVGGEVFAFWGLLNIITYLVYQYVFTSFWVWIIMVVAGISTQIIYVREMKKKLKYKLMWSHRVSILWLGFVLMLPLLFYVYPQVFKIYSQKAVLPIISLGITLGLFSTGLMTLQKSWYFAAGIFLTASISSGACIKAQGWIFMGAMVFGFVIPGIWSKYEQRKIEKK